MFWLVTSSYSIQLLPCFSGTRYRCTLSEKGSKRVSESRVNNKEFNKLQESLSIPVEWVTILADDHPPLSLFELAHTATLHDVYDALEMIEFKKYLQIEQRNLEQQQEG